MFGRKRRIDTTAKGGRVSFFEWAVNKDFFTAAIDPGKRTQNLLSEIQKRSLADQVFIISHKVKEAQCQLLHYVPSHESPNVNTKLLIQLAEKCLDENRVLFWEDLCEDSSIRDHLKKYSYESLLIAPLNIKNELIEALVIYNYSQLGDIVRITEFISFVSSVLALSLQNSRLFKDLKKKKLQLNDWTLHVEKRIAEGTKKLLEKEFQYYSLFEGANDGIVVHDPNGQIMEVNRVACRLLGYEKKELLSMNLQKLTASNIVSSQEEFFRKVSNNEKVSPFETSLKNKDGLAFLAELSSRRVRFRGKIAIQSFIRDVSVRKALEVRLRESKEKYQILVESSLIGAFIIRDGVIQFTNEMFEEIIGYSNDELLKRNFFDLVAPDDRYLVVSRETQKEKGEEAIDHYEVRFLKKNGDKCWVELRSRKIILDGRSAILGNVIDITQRKQLEIQLLDSQKMESIGTLAGGIAHDFNNLLGGILGYASLLLTDIPKDHPYYDDIYTIAETAKRAADLTNRLLAFARGGKYQVTALKVERIIQDVMTILYHTIDRSITLETHIARNIWTVKGDSQQIHQVFLNISLNAIDAMPGGGKFIINAANVVLDEAFVQTQIGLKPGEYIRISFSDTGIGMNDKTKSRIFEPFFTTKPAKGGRGLGLSMVYGIVKNHDGAVIVDSELGKGSKFTVFLPRLPELDAKVPRQEVKTSDRKRRVLLVDDEEVIRQVAKRMLEKGGFEVVIAKNGKEALQIYQVQQDQIDLVLLDLIMPEMGGKETYRRLKEFNPTVKVVLTSGYGIEDNPELLKNGEPLFIQKPFKTEILIESIDEILKN